MTIAPLIAALLLATQDPAPASCSAAAVAQLREAHDARRRVQVRQMTARLAADCADAPDYRFLAAVSLLDEGDAEAAFAPLAALAEAFGDNAAFAAAAGRAALRLGHDAAALTWLERAAALSSDDWRTWNGIGILRDRRAEWEAADRAYAQATRLMPDQATIWNNRGYSLMLRGRAAEALVFFDRALALDSGNGTIRRTRDLASALAGRPDDRRLAGESAIQWSRRLNNQGYATWLAGDTATARRLLSAAIEARATRFERAEANLSRLEAHR